MRDRHTKDGSGAPLTPDFAKKTRGERKEAANHGEEHFEALFCIERMGNSRGHDEHFACFHDVRRAAEEDFSLAVEDRHRGIEGSRVFGQTLSGIEGKERERTGVVAKNLARNYTSFCVFH